MAELLGASHVICGPRERREAVLAVAPSVGWKPGHREVGMDPVGGTQLSLGEGAAARWACCVAALCGIVGWFRPDSLRVFFFYFLFSKIGLGFDSYIKYQSLSIKSRKFALN